MKKKLLYISQVFPYPSDGGGKIKTLNTILTLAQSYEIHAVFISEKKPSPSEISYLTEHGVKSVKVFFNAGILASVKDDLLKLTKEFLLFRPHYVFQYTHAPAFSYIQNRVKTLQPNIIHIDHINIAQYLPKEKKEHWILEHHNLEFYLLWTRFLHSERFSRKLYLFIEAILTYFFERRMIRKFDHVFTISKEENRRVHQFFGLNNVTTQPLVYPIAKHKKRKSKKPYILFVGNLCWPPNEDAIEWFIKTAWPQTTKLLPQAELHVVGKRNKDLAMRLTEQSSIIFHDYQKNIDAFLAKADVFILPFRMGGGVRIKSLTALSFQIPIVSTQLGIEGLNIKDKKEYLLANNIEEFAPKISLLIRNTQLRKKISNNQMEYLGEFHSEKQNVRFLAIYEKVTQESL